MFLAIAFYVLVSPLLQLARQDEPTRLIEGLSALLGVGVLCLLPFLPMGHRALLAYRQGHVRYAGDGSVFTVGVGAFYGPIVLCVMVLLPFGLLVFALPPGFAPAALLLLSPPLWLLCLAIWRAGIQNAVWSGTRMPQVVIESRLSAWKLIGRYVLNALGMIVTLGLYWPFAAVATARLRLSAVSVSFGPDFERGISDPVAAVSNAGGDAAADLTGLDLGL
jgi:uncharacterized membrane protein YjgN (DUF898 family)